MTNLEKAAVPRLPFYCTPFGVWSLVALWGLLHLMLRALSTPVLGTDDMSENILVQTLEAGYVLRQPPLYEWVLWLVQQVAGPTIWSALIVKYGLISIAALFLFLLARKAISDPRLAAVCVFSYSLFYQFGWNLHEGVTHTVVLTTSCAASAYLFIKALEDKHLINYVLFGITVGAGFLSKHSYPVFAAALICAALTDGYWRRQLRIAGVVMVPIVVFLVYSPYAHWIWSDGLKLFSSMSRTMGVADQASHMARSAEGLAKLAFGLIGFSVPLVPVLLLLFWRRYLGRCGKPATAVSPVASLCIRVVIFMIVLTAILIVATGATHVKERHMHPLLLLLPIFLFADLERFDFQRSWRWLTVVVLAFAGIALAARVPGILAPDKFWCGGKCRHMKPYGQLQKPLASMGIGQATIVAGDEYTGGNMRVLFPGARIQTEIISAKTPPRARCFYIWEESEREPAIPARDRFAEVAYWEAEAPESASYIKGDWRHLTRPQGWRTTWWGVAKLDPDTSVCQ